MKIGALTRACSGRNPRPVWPLGALCKPLNNVVRRSCAVVGQYIKWINRRFYEVLISWIKRVWLLIGILILLFLLIIGVRVLIVQFSSSDHHTGVLVESNTEPIGPNSPIIQDIVVGLPKRVGKTNLMYIGVWIKKLSSSIPASSIDFIKYSTVSGERNLVNIIFTKDDGTGSYILLNKKAFIKSANIPTFR